MEHFDATDIRREFARRAEISRDLQMRLAKMVVEKRIAEDKEAEVKDQKAFRQFMEIMEAAQVDRERFAVRLQEYDTATVEALMQNEMDLKQVQAGIEQMLGEAYTLPDGRKVFKTMDGKRVFDETGTEMRPDEIKPEQIDDRKPRWETFQAAKTEELRLGQERADLHEYQGKLDTARERLDDPKLTKNELDALDKELADTIPDRARNNLDLKDRGAEADFNALVADRQIDTQRPTGVDPSHKMATP